MQTSTEEDTFRRLKRITFYEACQKSFHRFPGNSMHEKMVACLEEHGWTYEEFEKELKRCDGR